MFKRKFLFLALILSIGTLTYRLILPPKRTHSANFTAASASLSNARFSYRAGVATGTAGTSVVTIDGSGNADNDTNHLFPKDTVCASNIGMTGCVGNVNYVVSSIIDTTNFNTTTAIGTTFETNGFVVATQSGSLAISFTTATEVPIGGSLLITIPAVQGAVAGKANDGIPDTAATTAANGFDLSTVAAGDVSVSDITGCTQAGWGSATVTAGNGTSTDHTIEFTRASATCAASKAITVTIDSAPGIINPAPINGHTQGTADSYQINVKTRDGGDNTLDSSDVGVSPVEGVLISATVDETLSLTVAQIQTDSGSYCGVTRTASSPDSTATSIPWGTLSPTYLAATHNAQQQITVSTNASAGYSVYINESNQMGKDGAACTGDVGEAANCIKDTVCGASACTHITAADWGADPSSYPGLGYSLANVTGTDATFLYSAGTFTAKQLAETEASEVRQAIMTKATPADAASIYVCYRIDITVTQPAGYYYNKVQYTGIPIF